MNAMDGMIAAIMPDTPTPNVQDTGRIVKAVHGLNKATTDPAFEVDLSHHLRKQYGRDALLEL